MSLCVEEEGQGKKYNVFREMELVSVSSKPGGKYDSTAANSGKWSGAFACLEDKLGRRLVIVVC